MGVTFKQKIYSGLVFLGLVIPIYQFFEVDSYPIIETVWLDSDVCGEFEGGYGEKSYVAGSFKVPEDLRTLEKQHHKVVYVQTLFVRINSLWQIDEERSSWENEDAFSKSTDCVSTWTEKNCSEGNSQACEVQVSVPAQRFAEDLPYEVKFPGRDDRAYSFNTLAIGAFEASGLVNVSVKMVHPPAISISLEPVNPYTDSEIARRFECTQKIIKDGPLLGRIGCLF